ncbi:putative disease resistance protein RGA3 [Chenopodium quinoa]|uniref:putative disease resistance protein RGA3 n=1 Tax=Chenopodium quinoa TaxID=63459 RepID=UPI000B77F704|nr:putative disease resistance protein RGA3 [Chenopodium quinoa]
MHLVKLLCDSNTNNLSTLTVIGIVGMAGLGKTILCKRISKVHKVTKFFNSMVIWLVISSSFDLLDILNRMVEIVLKDSSNMRDRQALILRLHEKLKKKKYLLILDDVWDTIDWDSLKSTLEEIGGSRVNNVLVTSRDKFAVEKMETTGYDKITIRKPSIYMLQGLSECDSWSLLMKRIGDDNLGSEKELIARRMMKNCGGVPLAIKALGNLLRDKDIEIWKEFEKSHLWTNKDNNGILPSLRLSYDYLPCTALKKCFAYCAIFEEDDIIEKQKLICMWMTQGFLHPYVEMEAKGEEYIEHLLNSSLFQEPKMDEFGKVKTFKMHDLVLSLARFISKGECWFSDEDEMSNEVRHLIVPKHSKNKELTLTSSTKRLRTCLLYNKKLEGPSLHVLLKNNPLRVLDIGQNWSEDFDWELLGRLKHLRYFGSSVSHGLGFIAKLYQLQILCVYSHNQLVTDPNKSIFPKEIGNLVNLRHILYVNDIGVPLQTLPSINLGKKWGWRFGELGSLNNLRGTLKLYNLHNLSGEEEARSLLLDNKSYLSSLVFNWVHNLKIKKETNDNEILEALQPNVNLKMFEILNYCGTTFPKWLIEGGSSHPNLVSLKIYGCEAEGNLKLENLRCLRFLTIQHCKKLIIELPEEGFRCRESLEEIMVVDGCYYFRNPVGLGSLPRLRELCTDVIQLVTDLDRKSPVCKSLEKLKLIGDKTDNCSTNELPDQLQHLKALQCLAIEKFSNMNSIPNWLGKLTSLRELSLLSLPSLKYLPSFLTRKYFPNVFHEKSSCWVRHGETWSES